MLSEKQTEEFTLCWDIYRSPGNRSKKGESLKKWESVVVKSKDPELPKKIYDAILAQNRYQTDVNESMQFNRGFQVWLNQQGWLDEIKPRAEKKVSSKLCACKEPATAFVGQWRNGEYVCIGSCEKCYRQKLMTPEDRQRLKQNIKDYDLRKGEDESSEQFRKRLLPIFTKGVEKMGSYSERRAARIKEEEAQK